MWGGTTKAKENCIALAICMSSCDRNEGGWREAKFGGVCNKGKGSTVCIDTKVP